MKRIMFVSILVGAWLVFPAAADAAQVAVGIGAPGRRSIRRSRDQPEQATGRRVSSPIPALVVDVPAGVSLKKSRREVRGAALVSRRLAYTPNDPLVSKQWYLGFNATSRGSLPSFEPIPVAVIDSGVDKTSGRHEPSSTRRAS